MKIVTRLNRDKRQSSLKWLRNFRLCKGKHTASNRSKVIKNIQIFEYNMEKPAIDSVRNNKRIRRENKTAYFEVS